MAELDQAADKMRGAIGDQSNVASLIEQSAVDSAAGADQIAKRIGEVAKAAGEAVNCPTRSRRRPTGLTKVAQGLRSPRPTNSCRSSAPLNRRNSVCKLAR